MLTSGLAHRSSFASSPVMLAQTREPDHLAQLKILTFSAVAPESEPPMSPECRPTAIGLDSIRPGPSLRVEGLNECPCGCARGGQRRLAAGRRHRRPGARRRAPSCRSGAATGARQHRSSGVQRFPRGRLCRSGAEQHLARDALDPVGASEGGRTDPGRSSHMVGSQDRQLLWLVGEDDQASPRRVRLVRRLSTGWRCEDGARRSRPSRRSGLRAGEHRRRTRAVSGGVAAHDRRFSRRVAGDGSQRAQPAASRPRKSERSARHCDG